MSVYERFIQNATPFKDLQAKYLAVVAELKELKTQVDDALAQAQAAQARQMRSAGERQALEDKVQELTADMEQTRKDYQDLESGKITIKELALRNGSFTAEIGTEMAGVLAHQFMAVLEKVGAENYVEMMFSDKDDPTKRAVVIIQRFEGKSPHQLRQEAEAEMVRMRGKLDAMGS